MSECSFLYWRVCCERPSKLQGIYLCPKSNVYAVNELILGNRQVSLNIASVGASICGEATRPRSRTLLDVLCTLHGCRTA